MSTADTVKAQLQALIADANAVTGGESTNLTDAISALISGYGQTGGVSLDNVAVLIADYSDSTTYTVSEGAYYGTRRAICTI